MDQDEEEEDMADDEDEDYEEEEEDMFNKEKKKPFGDTRNYCPVALKDDNVLWPGSPEFAAKYRERVYYFSSPEARKKFLDSPKEFLAKNEPLKVSVCKYPIAGKRNFLMPLQSFWLGFISRRLIYRPCFRMYGWQVF